MGLLVGLDSRHWKHMAWCGVLSMALHTSWWGLLLLPLAGWMLPLAVDVKSIAIPTLAVLSAVLLPSSKAKAWIPWLIGIIATLTFASTLSGTDDHRVVLPAINRLTIEHMGGTDFKISPDVDCQEGMFESLWWIGGGLSIGTFLHQTWSRCLYKNPLTVGTTLESDDSVARYGTWTVLLLVLENSVVQDIWWDLEWGYCFPSRCVLGRLCNSMG